jgi:hypothetical protein
MANAEVCDASVCQPRQALDQLFIRIEKIVTGRLDVIEISEFARTMPFTMAVVSANKSNGWRKRPPFGADSGFRRFVFRAWRSHECGLKQHSRCESAGEG